MQTEGYGPDDKDTPKRPPDYQFSALSSPTSIRLLRLPGISSSGYPRNYSLLEVNLDDNPPYDALSYTWRVSASSPAPEPGGYLLCNGRAIDIGENLSAALDKLHASQYTGLIWIDALCINQSDLAERSAEVNLMGRIYRSAKTVVIWLGKPAYPETTAFGVQELLALPRIMQPQQQQQQGDDNNNNPSTKSRETLAAEAVSRTKMNKSTWLSIADVIGRPWFKRAWVIQEATLAQRTKMLLGRHTISWDDLENAVLVWAALTQYTQGISRVLRQAERALQSGNHLLRARECLLRGDLITFPEYLQISRTCGASDPRDHVFALLGIPVKPPPRASAATPLVADYSKSVTDVFIDCTAYLLDTSATMDVLSLVEDASKRAQHDLPSWVPDFTVPLSPVPFHTLRGAPFTAARSTQAAYSISRNPPMLHLTALRFSHITTTGETLNEIDAAHRLTRVLRLACNIGRTYSRTGEPTMRALWKTLTADLPPSSLTTRLLVARAEEDGETVLATSFIHFLAVTLSEALASARGTPLALTEATPWELHDVSPEYAAADYTCDAISGEILRLDALFAAAGFPLQSQLSSFQSLLANAEKHGDAEKVEEFVRISKMFYNGLARVCEHRRAFATANGCLGVGARSLGLGDEVWIVKGAGVPVVVRPEGGDGEGKRFRLVGECYVRGIMGGEALREEGEGDGLRWEEVRIV